MSGVFLRLACTAAMAAQAALAPVPAVAAPQPQRTVAQLLTDLQRLYQQAEEATQSYDGTAEKLKRQRAEVDRLDAALARARLSLQDSRTAVGQLARQQYQDAGDISPYVRLLLAPDPQHALDEGHVIGELAQQRIKTVDRMTAAEKRQDTLAKAARKALDTQLTLAGKQKKAQDDVHARLGNIERLLAALTPEQLGEIARLEQAGVSDAQRSLTTSGALSGDDRPPTPAARRAVSYAMAQVGKPYAWGAEGPASYDCSGLTAQAWTHAGTPIPRTSQDQWAHLPKVPLNRLRPGDLIVYYPKATHVALYIGDKKVVQAPRPGEQVQVSPLASYPVLGAVRP